ncbi:lipid droplet-regulating VLDL assembly factor AUP1 [Patella vulgata]|uniref:lipid droplet-regulating VLDL assembly factor AUP1 n=1 Tax=Patella vulgata TaxID=6465 RepID=UPI00218018E9|nr:lipid droplet-regulating VLDL assembly factor AUP1 [Patella vulgata]
MTSADLKSLFHTERFPRGAIKIGLVLYFPLGLFLATLRVFIFLHMILICQILPHRSSIRRFVVRVISGVLGFFITIEGNKNDNSAAKLIVSNHISVTDNFLIDLFFPNVAPTEQLPPLFIQLLSKYKQLSGNTSKEELLKEIKKLVQESKVPVLFYPEKTTTNGTTGLLKFSTVPFEIDETIKPVAVQYKRPTCFEVNMTTLESSWLGDIFWCFFVPCTFYKISVLPEVKKKEEESVEELTERVRSSIAKCLNIKTTEFTFSDKTELKKQNQRRVTVTNVSSTPSASNNKPRVIKPVTIQRVLSNDPVINNMVQQVKTVMPHVPLSAILQDIEKTKDIDLTITNILDGIVQYTPEENDNQKNTDSEQKQKLVCPSTQTFKSSTFGRTSNDRQLSFEERKTAMIEAARRKYKEKHNLS